LTPIAAKLLALASRFRALFISRRLDEDFGGEVEAHLEMLAEDYVRRGLTPEQARRAALVRFGGPMQTMEDHRERRSLPFVETTLQDIRYGLRSLRKNPAFAAVAVATLAIGIGAGTTVYSVVGAILLRPLPYQRPNELVRIFERNPLRNWTRNVASPANYADWRKQNSVFTDVAAYEQFTNIGSGAGFMYLTGQGEPQAVTSVGVTGNLFRVLGASPLMGRTFTDDETFEGKARVTVIGYGLWQSAFGGDPAIVGRTVTLSGRTFDVVGVMPRGFFFPGKDVQLWVPVAYAPAAFTQYRRPHYLGVIARRKPDVSLARAASEMDAIARRLEEQYPDTNTKMGVRLEGFQDSLAYESRPALLLLSAAVALLFLIVCVNVANLQLGRGATRGRELAIRRALGAGGTRLLRQLLTESLILSVAGGALGLAVAAFARAVLLRYAAAAIPLFADVRIDSGVLFFTVALSLMAPVIFGIVPAFSSARGGPITQRAESSSRETHVLRTLLVAGEVALSIVLVVGAVLFARSLARLQDVDPGFDPDHAITFKMTLPPARYRDAPARYLAFMEIERRLREQPGVRAVGASSTLALRGSTWSGDTTVEGRGPTDYERETLHASVTPTYFSAMGIRLLAGRPFDEHDLRSKPEVAIVNESLARSYFRGMPIADVVGRRIAYDRPSARLNWVTIVGVVADEKQSGLDRPAGPTAYSSVGQRQQNPLTFVVRTSIDPEPALAAVRAQVHAVDKDLALTDVATLDDVVAGSMADVKFRTGLLSAFAGLALLLAALGIYGVLAYFVSQRAREIGIRLALGAQPSGVFRMVVQEGLLPVAAGAVIGIAAAVPLTAFMRSLLFGIQPIDPPTYAIALGLLAASAAAACALPARRATRVDPLVALREE